MADLFRADGGFVFWISDWDFHIKIIVVSISFDELGIDKLILVDLFTSFLSFVEVWIEKNSLILKNCQNKTISLNLVLFGLNSFKFFGNFFMKQFWQRTDNAIQLLLLLLLI